VRGVLRLAASLARLQFGLEGEPAGRNRDRHSADRVRQERPMSPGVRDGRAPSRVSRFSFQTMIVNDSNR
jgi:hypothetical protein